MPPCLTHIYKVRIKGKDWCSSYRKGSLRVTLDYGRQLFLLYFTIKHEYTIFLDMISLKMLEIFMHLRVEHTHTHTHTYIYIYIYIYTYIYICIHAGACILERDKVKERQRECRVRMVRCNSASVLFLDTFILPSQEKLRFLSN